MRSNLKKIWRLGLPLSLTFVIQMIIIIVDSAFAGNISYDALAAVSLGSNTFYILLLVVIGVAVASSVMAGQAYGGEDMNRMINCFRQGTVLCSVIGLGLSFVLINSYSLMLILGQDADVVHLSKPYLNWLAWTLPIQALIVMYRNYFAVIDRPWAGVWPVVFALLLNAFLDYCLAKGNLGFPAMGIGGIGLASLISNIMMILLMMRNMGGSVVYEMFRFGHPGVWGGNAIWKLLAISMPISLTLFAEEAFFSGSVFLAGLVGVEQLAAHQILLNTIGTSYLFNTGIAIACAIIIGKHVGAGRISQILPAVKAGWVLVMIFTLPFALMLVFTGDRWIELFVDPGVARNQATILFVKSAMLLAITMLFLDAIWVVVIESLHGLLDTLVPAFCVIVAYWLIGGPLAWWATQIQALPFVWIWMSMLIAACVLTSLVFIRLQNKVRQLKNSPMLERNSVCE